jgi:hypothetical protein
MPIDLAAGDLDGDGLLDLVTGNEGWDTITLVRNLSRPRVSPDCNRNGVPDGCDVASGSSDDANSNGILDECEVDCDADGVPDADEIAAGTAVDCDASGVPDACELAWGAVPDCDSNGVPDACDVASGAATDANGNGVPDACERAGCRIPGDCTEDDLLGVSDAVCVFRALFLTSSPRLPCGDGSSSDAANRALLDWQGDGRIDISDGIGILRFLFLGGEPHVLAVPGAEMSECVTILGCPRL